MKQITLNVNDTKFPFFMELISNLDFIKIEEQQGDTKDAIVKNLKQGIKEIKLIQKGKLNGRPAKELLSEL